MKKLFCVFMSLFLLATCFTGVFAEGEPGLSTTVVIPVESNVETAEITISANSGEQYLPENPTIIGSGEFVLDFADAVPGDRFEYTIAQTGGVDYTYYADERVFTVEVLILMTEIDGQDVKYAAVNIYDETELKVTECRFVNTRELINARITVIKKSADTMLPLAGAEITIFDNNDNVVIDLNGNPVVGITDETGTVVFELLLRNDVNYYAMETKAPAGYDLNPNKFYLTRDEDGYISATIELEIIDEITIIPYEPTPEPSPQTGDESNLWLWVAVGSVAAVGIIALTCYVLVSKKKHDNESAEINN